MKEQGLIDLFEQDIYLPEMMREELKKPLGKLIRINPTERFIEIVKKESDNIVIIVGDYCLEQLLKKQFIPSLAIIDGKTLRKDFKTSKIPDAEVIHVKNPPAIITMEAVQTIQKIIEEVLIEQTNKATKPKVLFVKGEEDLLVIPAVLCSPNGTFIAYGQPNEGIVLIKVTVNTKLKFKKLVERMKDEKK